MNNLEKRIKEIYPNEDITVVNFTIMKEPATVKCNRCGNQYELKKAENFLRKGKKCICKKCINNKSGGRLSIEDFQDKINILYPNEKLKVLNYSLKNEKCSIKCLKCGNIYTLQNAGSFYNPNKKRVCSHCFPNKKEAMQNSVNNFLKFISGNKEFQLIEKDLSNIKSNTLVKCKCLKCGEINKKTIYDYLRGRGCSCSGNNVLITQEEFQKELGDEYTCLSEYKGREHKVLLKHNLCGFCYWSSGKINGCPRCRGSKGEKTIAFLLEGKNIEYIREKSVSIKNHRLRFDFYLPKFNCFIEFNGIQHYQPVLKFGGETSFKKQVQYDKLKSDYCKEKNINLLTIRYDENIKEKLFNYLLKFNDHPERE